MFSPLYKKTELSNGLRVVSEEIPHIRSVALGVWITVGSRDEDESNNGISHFLEHMLFKGTKKRNTRQIAESLEVVGGTIDAFTTKEATYYGAHVLDEHLPLAVDVLSDILLNSVFNQIEIEKEKSVVLKEINHYQDTPDDLVFEYFYQNMYQSHPLGFHIYGIERNIKNFFRDQILNFLNEQYAANRIVIAATGRLKHEHLISLIEKGFTDLPINKNRTLIKVPNLTCNKTIIKNNCSQAHVCFGTKAYAYRDAKKFPLMILNAILGGGMSSLLFQKIREEYGLVYSIYTFFDFFIDNGLFGIYFSSENKYISQIFDLIKQELCRVRHNYIDDFVMLKMKNLLKGNLILGLENTIGRMNRLARNEIYLDQFYSIDDVIKKIDNITINDVVEVAEELFQEENYFTTILTPDDN